MINNIQNRCPDCMNYERLSGSRKESPLLPNAQMFDYPVDNMYCSNQLAPSKSTKIKAGLTTMGITALLGGALNSLQCKILQRTKTVYNSLGKNSEFLDPVISAVREKMPLSLAAGAIWGAVGLSVYSLAKRLFEKD